MRTAIPAAAMAAAILTGVALPACAAVEDPTRADVRCLLGMSQMAKNEAYKQWGQFGVFYFTGRLQARDPRIDLAAEIKREYRQFPASEYNDEIKRCSDALGETSRTLEDLKPDLRRGTGR